MNLKTYNELVDRVKSLDHAYWIENKSPVPDSVYDALVGRIIKMEKEGIQPRADSPSQRIGSMLTGGFRTVKHVVPMMSLEKVLFDHEDLRQRASEWFANGQTVTVEPKLDGLTLDLRYEHGVLVQALTGGTGEEGEDVTENAKTLRSIPLTLSGHARCSWVPSVAHIRGECYISISDFKRMNEERAKAGEPLRANPRNAASGAMKRHDPVECARTPLRFTPYQVAHLETEATLEEHFANQLEVLQWLELSGFATLMHVRDIKDSDDLVNAVESFGHLRKSLDFPTDGCVVKVSSLKERKRLGDGTIGPRWAFAYKYEPEQIETKLLSITIQVGKTGILAPVAELQPVWLAGSVNERATLFNEEHIKKLGIMLGDTVMIRKEGECIPGVVSVLETERDGTETAFVFPDRCPVCQAPASKMINADGEEGSAWICTNHQICPAQIKGRLTHWCSKAAMNIENLGEEGIGKLVDGDYVGRPSDLYALQLSDLMEAGVSGASKVLAEIQKSRNNSLERVLYGLVIPRVGETMSKKLARLCPNLQMVLDTYGVETSNASLPDKFKELGAVNNTALINWLHDKTNLLSCVDLMEGYEIGMRSELYKEGGGSGPLSGQTIVITGELSCMERPDAERRVEALGGRATGSVSKKTTLLVVGTAPGNNKLTAAKKHGTKQIGEAEFLKLLEQT